MAQFNTDTLITIDDFDTTAPSVEFTGSGDPYTVTIDTGVFRGSTFSAVLMPFSGNQVVNNGTVFSSGLAGVDVEGDNTVVTNNATGTIAGRLGIFLFGNDATVTNHGEVSGYESAGVHIGTGSNQVVLTNTGEIFGRDQGIRDLSTTTGGTIVNSGLIHSDQHGVEIDTDLGLITTITNTAGGTIKGNVAAIVTESIGRLSLDNRGTIDGVIACDASVDNVNDVIVNRGKILGSVFLGDGDDMFNGNGGTSGEVFGQTGNDTLIGGKGNDTLVGGAGLDLIRGGRGKDNLFGGIERDLFDFNAAQESVKGGKRDVIQDFVRGNNVTGDDIDLVGIDAKTGVAGNQAFKFIGRQDFHGKKGELRFEDKGAQVIVQGDRNGDGKADFEILVKVGALSAGDFLL